MRKHGIAERVRFVGSVFDSVPMPGFRHLILLVLLGACTRARKENWFEAAPLPILVEPDVPEAQKNAVLKLTIRDPNGTSGSFMSLRDPSCGGGMQDGGHSEGEWEALAAIRKDRFVVLFTKTKIDGQMKTVTTKAVSFPFGVTTETDVLGFHVIGKFE